MKFPRLKCLRFRIFSSFSRETPRVLERNFREIRARFHSRFAFPQKIFAALRFPWEKPTDYRTNRASRVSLFSHRGLRPGFFIRRVRRWKVPAVSFLTFVAGIISTFVCARARINRLAEHSAGSNIRLSPAFANRRNKANATRKPSIITLKRCFRRHRRDE